MTSFALFKGNLKKGMLCFFKFPFVDIWQNVFFEISYKGFKIPLIGFFAPGQADH